MSSPRSVTQPSFVNRTNEMAMLLGLLPPQNRASKLIVLRSPPGFGKSRLTDKVIAEVEGTADLVVIVDPHVRSTKRVDQPHDGFFMQLCASEISNLVAQKPGAKPTLAGFLRDRRLQTVVEIRGREVVKQGPTVRAAWTAVFDLFERATSRGDYAPDRILSSDSGSAIRICREYLNHVLDGVCCILIVREAQYIDNESLKYLLTAASQPHTALNIILEYTSKSNEFEPAHHKQIGDFADKGLTVVLHDLMKLEQREADNLMRQLSDGTTPLKAEHLTEWDGNIRSLIEFRYRVTLQTRVTGTADLSNPLTRLAAQREAELAHISSREAFVLSVLGAHDGPIDREMLVSLLHQNEPLTPRAAIDADLNALEVMGRRLQCTVSSVSLRNDDVRQLVADAPTLKRFAPLAAKALREFYLDAWRNRRFSALPASRALRGAILGCARTGDERALQELLSEASDFIATSQTPTQYIDLVSPAMVTSSPFTATARRQTIDWAVEVAYAAADFERAANLVDLIPKADRAPFHDLVRACSLQEIGRHAESKLIALEIDQSSTDPTTVLMAQLVLLLVEGATGDERKAEAMLTAVLDDARFKALPALGYAHRFSEMFYDFDICVKHLAESVRLFDEAGWNESASYSRLSAAVHVARSGDLDGALIMFEAARKNLSEIVRDDHLIANNWSVLEMLQASPDYERVRNTLKSALFFVGDDFSELTLLSNLTPAAVKMGDVDLVTTAIERIRSILNRPKFGEKGIYWDATYSVINALTAIGRAGDIEEFSRLRLAHCPTRSVHRDYWQYRFGEPLQPAEKYRTMLRHSHHASYLSHWTIDLDGLRGLKPVQPL